MRRVLSIVLVVVGIAICISPFAGRYYVKYQQDKMYQMYLAELERKNKEIDNVFNEELEVDPEEVKKIDLRKLKGAIGLMEIPKIDVRQIMIEGSDAYALSYGIGHVKDTAFPGESGNAVFAGHRNATFGTFFSRLDELSVGDNITCEYEGEEYSYKVKESFIVKPEDVYVLEGKDDEHVMTLITCHPRGKTTHRLIVRAELVKSE